jgi:DNA-binding Lrp family transcriptional regulator
MFSLLLKKIQGVWKHRHDVSGIKSFKENQIKEDAFDARERGIRTVPLKQIVGSVGRYHDFDKKFQLWHHLPSDKLERVKHLMQRGVPLPPVKLYQIKDEYYVLDGNHRVAAAKALDYQHIEAQIVEFLPSKTTLENILYCERAEFLEKTGLQCAIELTEVRQYPYLLDQIQSHQYFLAQAHQESVSYEGAATDWYNTIYQPLVTLIQRSSLIESFPQRTLADLYTYISSHQWQKGRMRTYGKEIDQLIPNNMEEFRKNMLAKQEFEYPEMQREITAFVLMNVSAKRELHIIEKVFAFKEVREVHSVHGNVDIIAKIVLTRDLLSSDVETISQFVNHIRQIPGVISTQTLIPGLSKIKEPQTD